ncbi:MAG: peptidoglycan DD-metalloendopeptidase family protein [candidate division Zixibacteria bacterium]|nr:peptidoglycan DD-metalloendopeptidase family protein [candidate division Zixibacteria bacterium]
MKHLARSILVLSLVFFCAANVVALDWPVFPDSTVHRLGNNYGQFQCYGGSSCSPYMHSGIDIMVPPGTPVYAIKSGWVKAIITTSAELHWRVVVGDSAGTDTCLAYMYAHLTQYSITVTGLEVGDWVEEGTKLGEIVSFPYDFHHLHFSLIRFWGEQWRWETDWYYWEFAGNLLDELDGLYDPDPPVFDDVWPDQLLAFSDNLSKTYFSGDDSISGDVDIICRAYDYINDYDHKLIPYQLEYAIEGDSSITWTNSFCFTGSLGRYSEINDDVYVIFRNDDVCETYGDYDLRQYYFIMTNTDGDSTIELEDVPECWSTASFHNGDYMVRVRAHDRAGNSTEDSMIVTVSNYFSLSGTVTMSVGDDDLSSTLITVLSDGQSTTTDEFGDYTIDSVGGGSQMIEISRWGWETVDTVVMMAQNNQVDVVLNPGYCCLNRGNLDNIIGSGGPVDIADLTFLVSYLFLGGDAPWCTEEGNVDGITGEGGPIDIADLTYLVSYLFTGGPAPPACP